MGGTAYVGPTSEPIRDAVVLLRDGKIVAVGGRRATRVPTGVQTLDCSGLTVVAGFWNSHVHSLQRKWADAATLPAAELAEPMSDARDFARVAYTIRDGRIICRDRR